MVQWALFWFWLLKSSVAASVKTIIIYEKALTQKFFQKYTLPVDGEGAKVEFGEKRE